MRNLESLRTRYLKDPPSVRLGGLAANLSRISSFSEDHDLQQAVNDILLESKWFIEWTAPEIEIEKAGKLVQLQVQLAAWEKHSERNWNDDQWRNKLSAEAKEWSFAVLAMSGLLTPEQLSKFQ